METNVPGKLLTEKVKLPGRPQIAYKARYLTWRGRAVFLGGIVFVLWCIIIFQVM